MIERGASLEGYQTYEALKARKPFAREGDGDHQDSSAPTIRPVSSASSRALPFRFGDGDDWLKAGPLKIVADGGILIGTSFMREPYGLGARQLYAVDDPRYRGFLTLTPEQIASASRSDTGSDGRWWRT